MKQLIFAFGALIIILVLLAFFNGNKLQLFNLGSSSKITINNTSFNVRIAKTPKDRQLGLSNTSSLPENQGMLFLFDQKDIYPFWMRDMKLPIDMIFISDNKVVDIIKNAKEPSPNTLVSELEIYRPTEKANYVLEINAGLSDRYNFKKGDSVTFQNL